MSTPERLRALVAEPTEQVRFVGHADFMEINPQLAALAPQLAELCADMGEALADLYNGELTDWGDQQAMAADLLNRLAALLPEEET